MNLFSEIGKIGPNTLKIVPTTTTTTEKGLEQLVTQSVYQQ